MAQEAEADREAKAKVLRCSFGKAGILRSREFQILAKNRLLTPTLSGFENLTGATLIIPNRLVSRLVAQIFHHENFLQKHK